MTRKLIVRTRIDTEALKGIASAKSAEEIERWLLAAGTVSSGFTVAKPAFSVTPPQPSPIQADEEGEDGRVRAEAGFTRTKFGHSSPHALADLLISLPPVVRSVVVGRPVLLQELAYGLADKGTSVATGRDELLCGNEGDSNDSAHSGDNDKGTASSKVNPDPCTISRNPYRLGAGRGAGIGGMQEAVKGIVTALVLRTPIVIYGDYDTDGVTSSTILYRALVSLARAIHGAKSGEGLGRRNTGQSENAMPVSPPLSVLSPSSSSPSPSRPSARPSAGKRTSGVAAVPAIPPLRTSPSASTKPIVPFSFAPNIFVVTPEREDGYGLSVRGVERLVGMLNRKYPKRRASRRASSSQRMSSSRRKGDGSDEALTLNRPALLITTDNGITAFEAVWRAREVGFRIILTDHHLPYPLQTAKRLLRNTSNDEDEESGETSAPYAIADVVPPLDFTDAEENYPIHGLCAIPLAHAVVEPKLGYTSPDLSGAGVALKVVQALLWPELLLRLEGSDEEEAVGKGEGEGVGTVAAGVIGATGVADAADAADAVERQSGGYGVDTHETRKRREFVHWINRVWERAGVNEAEKQRILEEVVALAAIGTIADVMPLTGENRAIVRRGLALLTSLGLLRRLPGLRELMARAGIDRLEHLDTYHVAFILAPRLNAAGRMGAAEKAAELLRLEGGRTDTRAWELAGEIERMNTRRRQEVEQQLRIARAFIRSHYPSAGDEEGKVNETLSLPPFLVVWSEGFTDGIVGLVASRLAREYDRPTAVARIDTRTGMATASARNPEKWLDAGLSLIGLLEATGGGLLERYGGHHGAAGFSLYAANLPLFADVLNDVMREWIKEHLGLDPDAEALPVLVKADGSFPVSQVIEELPSHWQALAPFGQGNPVPVFHDRVRIRRYEVGGEMGASANLKEGWADIYLLDSAGIPHRLRIFDIQDADIRALRYAVAASSPIHLLYSLSPSKNPNYPVNVTALYFST